MPESDKRRYPRHDTHFEINVHPIEEMDCEFEEAALLRNISDGGICFMTKYPEQFHIGQHLAIRMSHRLPTPPGRAHLDITATIVWLRHCDYSINQAFIGVSLDHPIESRLYVIPEETY